MNACSWRPTLVKLHDGREVLSDSEEWRHECEALAILKMPFEARRPHLRGVLEEGDTKGVQRNGILQKRGEKACLQLEETIKKIWYAGANKE